jgi:hypothetical protein
MMTGSRIKGNSEALKIQDHQVEWDQFIELQNNLVEKLD